MVVPHDILCINGASAALQLSPLPVLRAGRCSPHPASHARGRGAQRQPDAAGAGRCIARPDRRRHARRAHDGEAGADNVSEGKSSRRSSSHTTRSARSATRRTNCAARPASRSGSRPPSRTRSRASTAPRSASGFGQQGLRRPARSSRADAAARHGLDRGRHHPPGAVEDEPWDDPREGPGSRRPSARCASSSRTTCGALTDAEQDSKELKSAKRHLLFERIVESVNLPFPVGSATARGGDDRQGLVDQSYAKKAAESDLQGHRPQEDRRRQEPPRRPQPEEIRPITCEVGVSPRAPRLRAVHARPDADHVAC